MEIHLKTECKSSASREVVFQHFQLVDMFSDGKLATEWELDVVLRMQLASFPTNWNLGNFVFLVNHVLDMV